SILYVDGTYYWYGENKEGITGMATGEKCSYWHHGVRLYSSADLYNWKDEGVIMAESSDPDNPFHPANIMDRPHILYNAQTKQYVMWCKTCRGDFSKAQFSVCVSPDLYHFEFKHEIDPAPYYAGDFDLFIHAGKAYVVFEHPHAKMIAWELDDTYTNLVGNPSCHLEQECPPYVREAPAYFTHQGRQWILTSGTTGYYPNPTFYHEMTSVHGPWTDCGDVCRNDTKHNSFHAQFSSVFKHPGKKNLYIALGDRWLTDLAVDLPNMEDAIYALFSLKAQTKFDGAELPTLTDENTSEADYVWLPILFQEDGTPYIVWRREWSLEEFD
ncbi:MAG: family 43 glycosylhydrolase, partial [Clostridia bacterium]|nr:family 43 glycosylhydrolase [Clostridia bacterium]